MFNEKQKKDMRRKIMLIYFLKHMYPEKKDIYEIEQRALMNLLSKKAVQNKKNDCFTEIDSHYFTFSEGKLWWPTINSFVCDNSPLILFEEKPCNFSNKELIELTFDFYRSTDIKTFNIFNEIYKKSKNLIYFSKLKRNQNLHGLTTYSYLFDTSYITVFKNGKYIDLKAIIHEFGHAINNTLNFNIELHKSYEEIVSTFFELISQEYFENIGMEQATINRLNDYEKKKNHIKDIQTILQIYKYLSNHDYPFLKSETILHNYNKNELNELFLNFNFEYYIYTTGFIVAVNLFLIYIKDKEYALYLLYKIIGFNHLEDKDFFQTLKEYNLTNIDSLYTYSDYIKRRILK